MKAIYNDVKHFLKEEDDQFSPVAFVCAISMLTAFVGTTFYIMAWGLTS